MRENPQKHQKKKQKEPYVNSPMLSSTTKNLSSWEEAGVLPSPALGRAETSCAARRAGPQASGWSCLLCYAFLSLASSPGGPAHSSSSNLTLTWSKALLGTLGPSRLPGWACSYRVVGKIWTNSTTLSPPVAAWLTLKRQGQIRIAVPLGAGMAGRGQKGAFSFLIWVQVSD